MELCVKRLLRVEALLKQRADAAERTGGRLPERPALAVGIGPRALVHLPGCTGTALVLPRVGVVDQPLADRLGLREVLPVGVVGPEVTDALIGVGVGTPHVTVLVRSWHVDARRAPATEQAGERGADADGWADEGESTAEGH